MKDAAPLPTPPHLRVIWKEISALQGKAAYSLRPPAGVRLTIARRSGGRTGLFKFTVWRGERECTVSLPTRLPEVCKIFGKAARGLNVLHHIAALWECAGFRLGPWKKRDRVSQGGSVLINQSLLSRRGIRLY